MAALSERWIVGWCPPKDSCGWTYQPARVIASVIVKTSQVPSVAKATSVESGGTTTRRAPRPRIPSTSRSTPSSTFSVSDRYPASPIVLTTAHAPANGPPDLVDCIVGLSIV